MNRILTTAAAFMTATVLGVSGASATIFTKDYHDAGVWNAYDDVSETYTMKFTDDGSKDGFWLVVSPGENPKTNEQEYAIFYGDRANNVITAYSYDGQNNANSFKTGEYLGTYENAFTDGGTNARYGDMTMFSLDVSSINSAFSTVDWSGAAFGDKQGIWFHQSSGSDFAYDGTGKITDYTIGGQMWLDKANQATNGTRTCTTGSTAYYCSTGTTPTTTPGGGSVPAPGGLALLMVGFAGMRLRRWK